MFAWGVLRIIAPIARKPTRVLEWFMERAVGYFFGRCGHVLDQQGR